MYVLRYDNRRYSFPSDTSEPTAYISWKRISTSKVSFIDWTKDGKKMAENTRTVSPDGKTMVQATNAIDADGRKSSRTDTQVFEKLWDRTLSVPAPGGGAPLSRHRPHCGWTRNLSATSPVGSAVGGWRAGAHHEDVESCQNWESFADHDAQAQSACLGENARSHATRWLQC